MCHTCGKPSCQANEMLVSTTKPCWNGHCRGGANHNRDRMVRRYGGLDFQMRTLLGRTIPLGSQPRSTEETGISTNHEQSAFGRFETKIQARTQWKKISMNPVVLRKSNSETHFETSFHDCSNSIPQGSSRGPRCVAPCVSEKLLATTLCYHIEDDRDPEEIISNSDIEWLLVVRQKVQWFADVVGSNHDVCIRLLQDQFQEEGQPNDQ